MATLLAPGDPAPDFDLPDARGRRWRKADLAGRPFVIYFYPKDDTPGCTREACDFTALRPRFSRLGVPVLGVSRGTAAAKERFAKKHGIAIPLLADEDGAVARAYGAWGTKRNYGREYEGIVRTTVLVGGDGRIAEVWRNVRVPGHAEEVLAAVRELATRTSGRGARGSRARPPRAGGRRRARR